MFNPAASQAELLAKLAKLDPRHIPVHGRDSGAIAGRAEYINAVCDLVAFHIEEMAADADASVSGGCCDEEDARTISDVGADLAGSISRAADSIAEAA